MKKKATSSSSNRASYQERYRSILEAYLYAMDLGAYVHDLNLGLQSLYRKKKIPTEISTQQIMEYLKSPEFEKREVLSITEAIKEIKSREDKLDQMTDSKTLDRIFLHQEYNPAKVLLACDSLVELIELLVSLSENSIKDIPIEGLLIEYFDEGKPDLVLKGKRFDNSLTRLVVRQWFNILRLSDKDSLDKSHSEELEVIYRSLPGILAYENSLELSKPKKSRSSEAMRKENDFLYLLRRYEAWKAKKTEETRRKRLNPKDWLREYALWTDKTLAIYQRHVSTKSKDGKSQEIDPSSKLAQERIDSIIKYAQKIKRERSKGGE